MNDPTFDYQALLTADSPPAVTSLIAYRAPMAAPLEAVLWSRPRKAWIYGPGLVARYLYDDRYQDRMRAVDRAGAERLAREALKTELPAEATLTELITEGQRMGWDFGPPWK